MFYFCLRNNSFIKYEIDERLNGGSLFSDIEFIISRNYLGRDGILLYPFKRGILTASYGIHGLNEMKTFIDEDSRTLANVLLSDKNDENLQKTMKEYIERVRGIQIF